MLWMANLGAILVWSFLFPSLAIAASQRGGKYFLISIIYYFALIDVK